MIVSGYRFYLLAQPLPPGFQVQKQASSADRLADERRQLLAGTAAQVNQ
jgi:hypothetical protein